MHYKKKAISNRNARKNSMEVRESPEGSDVSSQNSSRRERRRERELIKERVNIGPDLREKYSLHLSRKQTLMAKARQIDIREQMKNNFVVIFPDPQVKPWDKLPRFAFLDADISKLQNKET